MRDLCKEAKKIFLAALKSVDIERAVGRNMTIDGTTLLVGGSSFDLRSFREVLVISFGKASIKMGAAVEGVLGEYFTRGLLVSDRRHSLPVRSEVIIAGHPAPNAESLRAARRAIELVQSAGPNTLIIFLVSGGGSALLELPLDDEVTLEELHELNQLLVRCGASIGEINVIRKHLSRVKGGRLGRLAAHSTSVALLISDVNPGDLRSLASNPLMPDDSTKEAFFSVLERYGLRGRLPSAVSRLIDQGRVEDLPKIDEGRVPLMVLLLDNRDAVMAAARAAEGLGARVEVDFDNAEGPYRDVAEALMSRLLDLHRLHPSELCCVVSGGEVSCAAHGGGIGGRNQEFVLYCATRLAEMGFDCSTAVLSCGTDGIDGNSGAAGGVSCEWTTQKAKEQGLDVSPFFHSSDSHSFLKQVGGLVVTGPTGNNVRDIRVLLAGPR